MTDIVNLNRARKKKRGAEKARTAEANRVKYGRTKTEKQKDDAEKLLRDRQIDAHRLRDED